MPFCTVIASLKGSCLGRASGAFSGSIDLFPALQEKEAFSRLHVNDISDTRISWQQDSKIPW
jgi:hypothetical protein